MVRREEHAAGVVAVPFLAFLDGEHTAQLREHQFGGHHTTGMSRRSFAYKYATLPLDPYYVAMLLAMAQAQSELLPPDTAVFTVSFFPSICPSISLPFSSQSLVTNPLLIFLSFTPLSPNAFRSSSCVASC